MGGRLLSGIKHRLRSKELLTPPYHSTCGGCAKKELSVGTWELWMTWHS